MRLTMPATSTPDLSPAPSFLALCRPARAPYTLPRWLARSLTCLALAGLSCAVLACFLAGLDPLAYAAALSAAVSAGTLPRGA